MKHNKKHPLTEGVYLRIPKKLKNKLVLMSSETGISINEICLKWLAVMAEVDLEKK